MHNRNISLHHIAIDIPNRVVEICSDEENFLATRAEWLSVVFIFYL